MKHEEIFERLDPPPGGLAALRARIEARPRLARRLAPLAFAAVLAAIALLFWARRRDPVDPLADARRYGDVGAVALGLAPIPSSAVAVADDARATTALAEVRTANARVSFYWVSSTAWEP